MNYCASQNVSVDLSDESFSLTGGRTCYEMENIRLEDVQLVAPTLL